MSYTVKERQSYNQDRERACARLGITKSQYNWFRRKGNELQRLYEQNCNGEFDSFEDYEQYISPVQDVVNKKAKELNLYVRHQTDPRGASIQLDTEPMPESKIGIVIY